MTRWLAYIFPAFICISTAVGQPFMTDSGEWEWRQPDDIASVQLDVQVVSPAGDGIEDVYLFAASYVGVAFAKTNQSGIARVDIDVSTSLDNHISVSISDWSRNPEASSDERLQASVRLAGLTSSFVVPSGVEVDIPNDAGGVPVAIFPFSEPAVVSARVVDVAGVGAEGARVYVDGYLNSSISGADGTVAVTVPRNRNCELFFTEPVGFGILVREVSGATTVSGSAHIGDVVLPTIADRVFTQVSMVNAGALIDPRSFARQDLVVIFTSANADWSTVVPVDRATGRVLSIPWTDQTRGPLLPQRKLYVSPGPLWSVANRRLRAALRGGREGLLDAAGVSSFVPAAAGTNAMVIDGRQVLSAIDLVAGDL